MMTEDGARERIPTIKNVGRIHTAPICVQMDGLNKKREIEGEEKKKIPIRYRQLNKTWTRYR